MNGIYGCKVTGSNGNSIFLPATGYHGGTEVSNAGSRGYYWSATPISLAYDAWYLYFNSDDYDWSIFNRNYGQVVRPVSE